MSGRQPTRTVRRVAFATDHADAGTFIHTTLSQGGHR